MEIRPITREKFETRIISSCDPRIEYIPDFIVNFCARKVKEKRQNKMRRLDRIYFYFDIYKYYLK